MSPLLKISTPAVLSLAFGVLFALLVKLLLVPSLYAIGEDMQRALQALKSRLFGSRQVSPE